MPPPLLSEMATFAHVVESGSFSAAARLLGSRKSSVSAQIQRLERSLGVKLLNRTTRRVDVTEAGTAFYAHCARIVAEANEAAGIADSFHNMPRGRLTLAAPDTFGWMHVAPLLPSFLERYPDISIELSLSERHVDLLAEHVDVAIRIGKVSGGSLTVRRLGTSSLLLCAAPSRLAGKRTIRTLRDLAAHDALAFTPLGWGNEWRLREGGREVRVPIVPRLASDSGDVLRMATLGGAGVALLPRWMVAADIAAGRLVHVLPGMEMPAADIHAVMPPGRERAAKVLKFVEHVTQHLRDGRKSQGLTRPTG